MFYSGAILDVTKTIIFVWFVTLFFQSPDFFKDYDLYDIYDFANFQFGFSFMTVYV